MTARGATRPFGPLGDPVPLVGQGTWKMGRAADRRREVDAIRLGLDLGLAHLDTAEIYGDGSAEAMLAEALAGRRREDVFLVSKVWPDHATYRGTLRACDESLRRLRIDHLDVYLLHWPSHHPLEETMGALEELVRQGKIRALGVSNFDVDLLQAAERALTRERIACNQVLYHLGERAIERRLLPYCRDRGIAVVGYSPFGSGDFPSPSSRGGKALAEVARRHGATPRQVALAFLVREAPLFTIPKSARPDHVRDNAAALAIKLTDEDVTALDADFPIGPDRPLAVI